MAASPWTTADDTTLRGLHESGRSLHSIAAEMHRSKATISEKAAKLGLSWDRTRTANAAHAVAVDNKARRAAIEARIYAQVEAELTSVESAGAGGWRTILKGAYGAEETKTLDFVPPRDRREAADTVSRYMATATKIAVLDSGDQDTSAVASWLAAMLGR